MGEVYRATGDEARAIRAEIQRLRAAGHDQATAEEMAVERAHIQAEGKPSPKK